MMIYRKVCLINLIMKLIMILRMSLRNKLLKFKKSFDNNKSLIVYVNHVLLGSYFRQFV